MLKTITTIAASAAALAVIAIAPASASPKIAEEISMFAPSPGVDVVERKGRHFGHRHGFRHFGFYKSYAYQPCFWTWKYGRKIWICY